MKLSGIVKSLVSVFIALDDGIGSGDGELGGDLVERVLRRGKSKLILEEGGFGRVSVGIGEIQPLGRIEELLCFLHEA